MGSRSSSSTSNVILTKDERTQAQTAPWPVSYPRIRIRTIHLSVFDPVRSSSTVREHRLASAVCTIRPGHYQVKTNQRGDYYFFFEKDLGALAQETVVPEKLPSRRSIAKPPSL